ncbi:MAG TPA: chorismate synthase [Acidimicrobiia bacterium]|nr:chorismate synthase [Acidimicrobiia bacterium]
MLRFLTAGESHGPGLVTIVEGLPAGLEVTVEGLSAELARRRMGHGRSRRMEVEQDELEILGGVRFGRTLGSPVAVVVRNTEWPRWAAEMAVGPGEAERPLTTPRPGHADLPGMQKYATTDARDILERASARETAARTVAGHLAKRLLASAGITVVSHVISIGDVTVDPAVRPGPSDLERVDASPVRTLDEAAATRMVQAIDRAREERDTLGGVAEVIAYGVPAGVGSHVHWDRRLDGLLAGAMMSIPAIKAVAAGDGFVTSSRPGSGAHDEIVLQDGALARSTDRAGGVEGGMSTGQPIRVQVAMKPLSTLMRPSRSVDVATGEPAEAFRERSDVCAVPAAAVVGEQMMAFVIAGELARMFGGDTLDVFAAAVEAHRRRVAGR